jgi:hypothetical protein
MGQLNSLQDAEEAPRNAHLLPYKMPPKVVDFLEVSPLRGGEVVVLGLVIIKRRLPVFPGQFGGRQPLVVGSKISGDS